MSQTGLLLSAMLGVDYRLKIHETATRTKYVTIGLRGGYLYTPFTGDWRTHGAKIQEGPQRGLNGGVILLSLGFSSKRHSESTLSGTAK